MTNLFYSYLKKLSVSALVALCFFTVDAGAGTSTPVLSESAEVTMLTSSPGEELYSIFGHSALRVDDPENNIDKVYNYGTFDFDTPNFYLKFARGQLMYMLSVTSYRLYELEYRMEGRAVYEQVLDLSKQEKQRIFEFLEENALPENRYYQYDFFYDNCATRIRDIIDDLFLVQWYEDSYETTSRTFRDLLEPYLEKMPWNKFGIDIVLGLPSDKVATPYEYMFLPDEMYLAFASARMADGSPLVSEHRVLLEEELVRQPPHPLTPVLVCWLVFALGLFSMVKRRVTRIFDMIFFSLLCINGLTIMFLWFASEHVATNSNMNLLWSLPTHVYFFYQYHFKKLNNFSRLYFRITLVISALFIFLWQWIPQDLNTAFFPLILLVFIKTISPALNVDLTGMINTVFSGKKTKGRLS